MQRLEPLAGANRLIGQRHPNIVALGNTLQNPGLHSIRKGHESEDKIALRDAVVDDRGRSNNAGNLNLDVAGAGHDQASG